MFDKNLILSYCRSKVEAAHWASKQLSQKENPSLYDAMQASTNTGKAKAYNAVASVVKKGITTQSSLAGELTKMLANVKDSAEFNNSKKPCVEVMLNGESLVGQAVAISDISGLLSQKFFEK